MSVIDRIEVFTQNSIRIKGGGKIIYIDPFKMIETPRNADFVLITHEHFDHFSPEDIKKVSGTETVLIVPESMKEKAGEVRNIVSEIRTVSPGTHSVIDGLEITAIPAYNAGKPFHPESSKWVGYILDIEGEKVYIAGDTDAIEEAASVKCDVAMVPIGGRFTMNAEEAASLINRMRPKYAVPTHYGENVGTGEKPEVFAGLVEPPVEVRISEKFHCSL